MGSRFHSSAVLSPINAFLRTLINTKHMGCHGDKTNVKKYPAFIINQSALISSHACVRVLPPLEMICHTR